MSNLGVERKYEIWVLDDLKVHLSAHFTFFEPFSLERIATYFQSYDEDPYRQFHEFFQKVIKK